MNRRHARRIRAGILAARRDIRDRSRNEPLLHLTGLGWAAYKQTRKKHRESIADAWRELLNNWDAPATRPPEAAETITQPRVPGEAARAGEGKPATNEGEQ